MLLIIDALHLVGWRILRYIPPPVDNILACLQGTPAHVISNLIEVPPHVSVRHGMQLLLRLADFLQGPVDGVPGGALVNTCGKPDDQLTVAKDAGWMVQLGAGLGEARQALDGVPECKGFSFVVGPPWAIVAANPHHFLVVFIKNHKPPGPYTLLRPSIKLDVDIISFHKPSFGWEVHWLLEATQHLEPFIHYSHLLLHAHDIHRWRLHAQLWRCRARLVKVWHQELGLVLEQVNDKCLQRRVGTVG